MFVDHETHLHVLNFKLFFHFQIIIKINWDFLFILLELLVTFHVHCILYCFACSLGVCHIYCFVQLGDQQNSIWNLQKVWVFTPNFVWRRAVVMNEKFRLQIWNFLPFATTMLLTSVMGNSSASSMLQEICTSCHFIETYLRRVRFSSSLHPDMFITYNILLSINELSHWTLVTR